MLPSIEKIADDILKVDITKHKMECDDFYENFLIFFKISFIYTQQDTTFNTNRNIIKDDIIEFLKKIDLEKYYKMIRRSNFFVCTSPSFNLFYINENQLYNEIFTIGDGKIDDIINSREFIVLYMMKPMSVVVPSKQKYVKCDYVRYARIPNGYKYLIIKNRLKKERKLKLERLDEI